MHLSERQNSVFTYKRYKKVFLLKNEDFDQNIDDNV